MTPSEIRTRLKKLVTKYACNSMLVVNTSEKKNGLIIRLKTVCTRVDLGFVGPEGYAILRAAFKENTKLSCFCKV